MFCRTKIQAAFRGHKARKSLTDAGKVLHKDHRKSWEWKRWSWEGPSTLPKEQLDEFLEDLQVPLEAANKYATKIQAVYRGHAVRRSLGEAGAHVAAPKITRKSKDVENPDAAKPADTTRASISTDPKKSIRASVTTDPNTTRASISTDPNTTRASISTDPNTTRASMSADPKKSTRASKIADPQEGGQTDAKEE